MNNKRILIGALAGGVAWSVWSMIVNIGILGSIYMSEGAAGHLLIQPRYGVTAFMITWFVTIFLLSGIGAWLYANVRGSQGAGPRTALKVGGLLGFAAGFPINLSIATWDPVVRTVPLWWMLDMWAGAIIAILVAGWLYKET
ncbi:MAG: hypothetical protein KGJ08_08910 [Gammaproteobacteria bacterium]|nr:hypothetical protein [Gammaproteobacteria bacterium]